MAINRIESTNKVIPSRSIQQKEESKQEITQKENKKKLILTLAGLAVVSAGAIALLSKNKAPMDLSLDEFKKSGQFNLGFANYKNKPFTGKINVIQGKDKFILEYNKGALVESSKYKDQIINKKKVYKTNNGIKTIEEYSYNTKGKEFLWKTTAIKKDEISSQYKNLFWNIDLHSSVKKQQDGSFLSTKEVADMGPKSNSLRINTINTKTNEVLDKKLVLIKNKIKQEPIIRKTQNDITTINGKVKAKTTKTVDKEGNRIITVDYGSNKIKTITIAKDGTRTETKNYRDLLDL